MSDPTRTARDSVLYTAGLLLPGVVNLVTVALHTRFIGPSEYGRYATAVAIAIVGQSVLFQWLGTSVLRLSVDAAPGTAPHRAIVATALRLGLGVMGIVALVATASALAVGDGRYVLGVGSYAAAIGWYELNVALARSLERPMRFALLSLARSLGVATLSSIVAWRTGSAFAVLVASAAGFILATLSLVSAWRTGGAFDRSVAARMARFGMPLSVASLLSSATAQLDRFFIGGLVSMAALGTYAAAQSLAQQSVTLLVAGTAMATYSRLLRGFTDGANSATGALFSRAGYFTLAVAAPAAVGLAVLGPAIASVLLGRAYQDGAATVVAALALAALLSGLREYHYARVFQGTRQTTALVWFVALALVLSATLHALLVPRYGIRGALATVVIAQGTVLLAVRRAAQRAIAMPSDWPEAARLLTALGAMAVLLFSIRHHVTGPMTLLLAIVAGALMYTTALLSLNFGGIRTMVAATVSRQGQ